MSGQSEQRVALLQDYGGLSSPCFQQTEAKGEKKKKRCVDGWMDDEDEDDGQKVCTWRSRRAKAPQPRPSICANVRTEWSIVPPFAVNQSSKRESESEPECSMTRGTRAKRAGLHHMFPRVNHDVPSHSLPHRPSSHSQSQRRLDRPLLSAQGNSSAASKRVAHTGPPQRGRRTRSRQCRTRLGPRVAPRRPYVPFSAQRSTSRVSDPLFPLLFPKIIIITIVSIFRTLKVRMRSLAEFACFGRQLKWIPPCFL